MKSGHEGMGSHQSALMLKDEWLTPPDIIRKIGPFDLDPCAPINPPWQIAERHFTIEDDGLHQAWRGMVFCNPPYGSETKRWLEKCRRESEVTINTNVIVLIFARTETKMWFDYVWSDADVILFLKGRLYFHHINGSVASANAGAPSALIAYGKEAANRLVNCNIQGKLIPLK